MRLRHRALIAISFGCAAIGALTAQTPVESGTILVSLIERPIGKETFELRADGAGWRFTGDLDLLERGGALKFTASLQLDADLSPTRLTAKGRTYRFVNSDVNVEIAGGSARVSAVEGEGHDRRDRAEQEERVLAAECRHQHEAGRERPDDRAGGVGAVDLAHRGGEPARESLVSRAPR